MCLSTSSRWLEHLLFENTETQRLFLHVLLKAFFVEDGGVYADALFRSSETYVALVADGLCLQHLFLSHSDEPPDERIVFQRTYRDTLSLLFLDGLVEKHGLWIGMTCWLLPLTETFCVEVNAGEIRHEVLEQEPDAMFAVVAFHRYSLSKDFLLLYT